MMTADKIEERLLEELGAEELLLSVYKYYGEWQMRDCYEYIANVYDIELEEE